MRIMLNNDDMALSPPHTQYTSVSGCFESGGGVLHILLRRHFVSDEFDIICA